MLKKEHADTLRSIAQNDYMIDGKYLPPGEQLEAITSSIEDRVRIEASDDAKYNALQDIGKSAAECIAEMVAALECDYDRLEELREERAAAEAERVDDVTEDNYNDKVAALKRWHEDNDEELADLAAAAGECDSTDDAETRIQEDPLEVTVRGDWHSIGAQENLNAPTEFNILLGTGGPATRICGELDEHGEPTRAWLEAQDWGTPWTEYRGDAISSDDLLTYCRCFYFGEG